MRVNKSAVACLVLVCAFSAFCVGVRLEEANAPAGIYSELERDEYERDVLELETLGGKIDINSASAETLTLLPGIGEVKAAAIVEYREENGEFESVNELLNVDGVGEKVLSGFIDYISTGESE